MFYCRLRARWNLQCSSQRVTVAGVDVQVWSSRTLESSFCRVFWFFTWIFLLLMQVWCIFSKDRNSTVCFRNILRMGFPQNSEYLVIDHVFDCYLILVCFIKTNKIFVNVFTNRFIFNKVFMWSNLTCYLVFRIEEIFKIHALIF